MGKNETTVLKVLFDAGIHGHSHFAVAAVREDKVNWGGTKQTIEIQGVAKKPLHKNREFQKQLDALFTVGRLIREGRISPYIYPEITWELMRTGRSMGCDALHDCKCVHISAAIERSKFMSTIEFREWISKGGKKDRKKGRGDERINQIGFLTFLCSLTPAKVDVILAHRDQLQLSDFECKSLQETSWFQHMCQRSQSSENYPDVFHLWTAERNGLDAFLTLDSGLASLVQRVRSERKCAITIKTDVILPLELLRRFGIDEPDPVPLEVNRFYHIFELPQYSG